jgi:hypothetical protein
MGKRLQDRVEEIATEIYGVGTALSVDHDRRGGGIGLWAVRIWDSKGEEVACSLSGISKEEALKRMRADLEKISQTKEAV